MSGPAGADQGDGEDGDDDEMLRRVAHVESQRDAFRSMTSLDVAEARDLYREAASAAAAQAARGERRRRGGAGGGAGGGGDAPASGFMPYAEFLMALTMVRKNDDFLVDFIFRAPKGTARAALDAALPVLLELRGMPRRFARRLVPFGYKLPPRPRSGKGCGNILDYT